MSIRQLCDGLFKCIHAVMPALPGNRNYMRTSRDFRFCWRVIQRKVPPCRSWSHHTGEGSTLRKSIITEQRLNKHCPADIQPFCPTEHYVSKNIACVLCTLRLLLSYCFFSSFQGYQYPCNAYNRCVIRYKCALYIQSKYRFMPNNSINHNICISYFDAYIFTFWWSLILAP